VYVDMNVGMAEELASLHAKLTLQKAHTVKLRETMRFESGCVYSLKRLLGVNTQLHLMVWDRLLKAPRDYVPLSGAATKDLVDEMCTSTHGRIQKELAETMQLESRIRALRQERALLEARYCAQCSAPDGAAEPA
jgi:hypothetical protein